MPIRYLAFTPRAGGLFPDGVANGMEGGLHVVADATERDAIPSYRRLKGMLVHVLTDNTIYRLTSEPSASPTWAKVMVAPAASGDAGKVLTVVNGEPAWTTLSVDALPSGGGAGKFLGYKSDNSGAEWKTGFLSAYALPSLASGFLKSDGSSTSWGTPGIRHVPLAAGAFATDLGGTSYLVIGTLYYSRGVHTFEVRTGEKVYFRAHLATTDTGNRAYVELYSGSTKIASLDTTNTVTNAPTPVDVTQYVTSGASQIEEGGILEVRLRLTTDASTSSGALASCRGAYLAVG